MILVHLLYFDTVHLGIRSHFVYNKHKSKEVSCTGGLMLIIEHLKSKAFSDAENQIADYLIQFPHELAHLTTQNLANFTHTNPNSVIRLAKKLGFDGWTSLKEAYQKEWQYLNSHFNVIDANIPFHQTDDVITIMHKLAQLEQNTISDTVSLVRYLRPDYFLYRRECDLRPLRPVPQTKRG